MPKYGSKGGGGGVMTGSTRSSSYSAPMESKGGNCGKPIGDTGKESAKGNRRTRQVSDRYK